MKAGILIPVLIGAMLMLSSPASALNAVWNSASDIPVTADSYTTTDEPVSFTLNFAPAVGTDLMVILNTGPIVNYGNFNNLAQGQRVVLYHAGLLYHFVANYFGGSGNDLVLFWKWNTVYATGRNGGGQIGDGTIIGRQAPVSIAAVSALTYRKVISITAGAEHSLALCSDGSLAAWGSNVTGEVGETWPASQAAISTVWHSRRRDRLLHGERTVKVSWAPATHLTGRLRKP